MRLIRTDVFCCAPTFCQVEPIAMVGCLVEDGTVYQVRSAFVPMRVLNQCGPNVEEVQAEVIQHGALCREGIARSWFPELEGKAYHRREYLTVVA